ncbi:MAG: hypothetical protein M1828_003343 [Chrysothrix sp. TS-e1954]|nr:MAG: hypothetical protein M1828_003343 [Chrysothrix sp. TS-e1954]
MPSAHAVYRILRLLTPRIPLLLLTTLTHSLNLHENAQKWDLRMSLIVTLLKSIMAGPPTSSISAQQRFSSSDPGIKGNTWVAKVTLPETTDEDVLSKVLEAVEDLKKHFAEDGQYERPTLREVGAEWTGNRAGTPLNAPEPDVSEAEKYARLMHETSSLPGMEDCTTVLYFHGGAHYMMDPATHRVSCRKLAQLTGGRVLSVRYRLAPQHPFPAALVDALVSYLSLLYPVKGSLHQPVMPEKIVFAGDSAGGNLALALIQLLLYFRRTSKTMMLFNGREIDVPLPAGVACMSAWCDITRALPSLRTNQQFDYLPPPAVDIAAPTAFSSSATASDLAPFTPHACGAWPSNPPRCDLYCEGSMLGHPLASPLAATVDMWKGTCPLFFTEGEEMLADEVAVIVRRAAQAGGRVRWEGFEGMPHCFGAMAPGSPGGRRSFNGWAGWIASVTGRRARRGSVDEDERTQSAEQYPLEGGVWIQAKTLEEKDVDLTTLTNVTDEQCEDLMRRTKETRIAVFNRWVELRSKELEKGERAKL